MKPWLLERYCLPRPGARFVAKMEDVLEVYQRPYDPRYPQVALDEISKVLRSTPRGQRPPRPARPVREDYEYRRHGTCALFMAFEPLVGQRHLWVRQRRTMRDFAEVLRALVDEIYPHAEKVVLVLDNLNIHHAASLYERFAPAEARRIAARLEWHYTPEHASWLNVAECELAVLKRQCLNRRIPDMATVEREVAAWQAERNRQQVGADWRFTTQDARIKLKHLYPNVNIQASG